MHNNGQPPRLTNTLQIIMYFQCGKCLAEKPDGIAPRDWARFNVGATLSGIQVWCVRHDCNVIHIDFEGQKHPADTSVAAKDKA